MSRAPSPTPALSLPPILAIAAIVLLTPLTVALAQPAAATGRTPDSAPDTAQEVVDRAIAFHGGDLYEGSETTLTITSRSGSFRVVSRMEGDRFDHQVISDTRKGAEQRVRTTNDRVEVWLDGVAQEVSPEEEQGWRDMVSARVYFPFLPYRLNDPSVHKQDLGFEEWDGRRLRKIKVTFEVGTSTDASDEYLYWFDPDTGRLEQFAYSFHTGNGGVRLRKGFNYRRVGGILFMDSENWGRDGRKLTVDDITPETVAKKLKKISTVELSDIEVEPVS